MTGVLLYPAVAVRFIPDEIHDSASKMDLVKIVICANCQEIPYRPIYSCQNGHVICSSCRGFNFRCGSCSTIVTDTRNRVAEEIVMTFVFKCKHTAEGCKMLLSSSDILKHLQSECQFRAIACHETLREKCKGKGIGFANFLKHLRDVHGIRKHVTPDGAVARSFSCDTLDQNQTWPLYCFEYEGVVFFQHIVYNSNTVYVWITHFDVLPRKYNAVVEIRGGKEKVQVSHCFRVQPFRTSFGDVKLSGHYLQLNKDQFLQVATLNSRDEKTRQVFAFAWKTTVNMLRVRD